MSKQRPNAGPSNSDGDGDQRGWPPERSWARMFLDAVRGMTMAMRGEVNFVIHLTAAMAAIGLGAYAGLTVERWCLLGLCITVVLAAEMLNTAIEHLARAVSHEENSHIRNALDIASGAVLVAAIGAAIVGVAVLAGPLLAQW